jgi:multiple sugar transport system permease protein
MSPIAIGISAFVVYPVVTSLYYSFTRYNVLSAPRWAGLSNYRFMAEDPLLRQAIRNTLWIAAVGIPVSTFVALGISMLLARPGRGIGIYRTVFYLPSVVPTVAATLGFLYVLDPGIGPVNKVLGFLHLPQPLWFHDPAYAKPGLVLLGLWGIGPMMLLFLAGLLSVPPELYEATEIEGAGAWQRFRRVTLPMLSPVILFTTLMGVIGSFQYFAQAYVTAGLVGNPNLGSPQGSTLFYSLWLFKQAFVDFRMGYASALAWALLVGTMICAIGIIRTSRRWVFYRAWSA